MKTTITKAVLGLTLGATALTAAAPAEAQRYRYRDRDNAGTAIVAGIAGIAIGAAIAGSGRDRYYDRRYRSYDRGYYNYDNYYQQRGYYPRESYYYRDYERRGWRGCTIRRVYDPYLGQRVRVRYCR
ncbi:hypothetical protein M9978_06475 [Sphingomonas sp. MG17]|jgi:hypothetical protein|uniref:PXPV repeat-containing protein n=1 Tax=Sphingomonas tagetis TaxID=2949092 RepID=A0A9X2HJP2_9SPHN|nr:hypothetical protein [Sphingomonas tagetis]MCP3730071.1 hypothetical protein [Sphingomonas tagetis]